MDPGTNPGHDPGDGVGRPPPMDNEPKLRRGTEVRVLGESSERSASVTGGAGSVDLVVSGSAPVSPLILIEFSDELKGQGTSGQSLPKPAGVVEPAKGSGSVGEGGNSDHSKRTREQTSSEKKPRKRRNDNDDMIMDEEEIDRLLSMPSTSWADEVDARSESGISDTIGKLTVDKEPEPEKSDADAEKKKRNRRKRARYADMVKNTFRLWITKDGTQYNNLTREEFRKTQKALDDKICGGIKEIGFLPRINWFGRSNAGKTIVACDDQQTVNFIKEFVKQVDAGYGAWMQNEGPNLKAYVVVVPFPTADRPPERILEIIKENNGLQGVLVNLNAVKFKTGINIMAGLDDRMVESMTAIDFQPYIGVFRVRFNVKTDVGEEPDGDEASDPDNNP